MAKLRPMRAAGQFFLVRESDVLPVTTDRNLLPTTQLPEDRVLAAARATPAGPGHRSTGRCRPAAEPAGPLAEPASGANPAPPPGVRW